MNQNKQRIGTGNSYEAAALGLFLSYHPFPNQIFMIWSHQFLQEMPFNRRFA